VEKQRAEFNRIGASKELSDRHDREIQAMTERFEEERERYSREYHDAKRIAQEIEQQQKQVLEPGLALDQGKKFSR
jgi:hypothetical protein